jgi:hypothetical protein
VTDSQKRARDWLADYQRWLSGDIPDPPPQVSHPQHADVVRGWLDAACERDLEESRATTNLIGAQRELDARLAAEKNLRSVQAELREANEELVLWHRTDEWPDDIRDLLDARIDAGKMANPRGLE